MRKIIALGILAALTLTLSTGDADARRRHRTKHNLRNVAVVHVPVAKPLSVFDTGAKATDWDWVVSPSQVEAASRYVWTQAELFPPVKVEWTHANEVSTMDRQVLEQGQITYHKGLGALVWALFGAVCGALLGGSILVWFHTKELIRLT